MKKIIHKVTVLLFLTFFTQEAWSQSSTDICSVLKQTAPQDHFTAIESMRKCYRDIETAFQPEDGVKSVDYIKAVTINMNTGANLLKSDLCNTNDAILTVF